MSSTAATHLTTIATLWPELDEALETPRAHWYGLGLNTYLRQLDQTPHDEPRGLRALERNPNQIGASAAPINLRVLDAGRIVETTLIHLADTLAPAVTEPATSHAPADWAAQGGSQTVIARRNARADAEQADPRRWRYTGLRTVEYAAGWLLARVEGRSGPFRALTEEELHRVERVAAGCAARVETALGLLGREYAASLPCPTCAGKVVVTAGGGEDPVARCGGACGRVWTMADTAAA